MAFGMKETCLKMVVATKIIHLCKEEREKSVHKNYLNTRYRKSEQMVRNWGCIVGNVGFGEEEEFMY